MASCRPRPSLLASVLLFGILALLAASPPAGAAGSCKRVALRVSKHKIKNGSWLRVKGHVCHSSGSKVRIKMHGGKRWRTADRERTRSGGSFSGRVHVRARGGGVVRLRATGKGFKSKIVRIHVSPRTCALDGSPGEIGMAVSGCRLLSSDTASRDPRQFWGQIECGAYWNAQDASRALNLSGEGDTHVTATGAPQGNSNYRRLTVLDGDDYSGERCELGQNNHLEGPTAFYREGQRRLTYISLRLPTNFPLDTDMFQTVMQMKEAQPSDCCAGGAPILFMGAYDNEWHVESINASPSYWTFPARSGVWTRFAWDVFYSDDPNRGWLQVSADLNDDGDFNDAGERTPVIHGATLKTEVPGPHGGSDGLDAGDPIPDHLRTGIYHDTEIPCPAPTGCSIEVDNVQVLAP